MTGSKTADTGNEISPHCTDSDELLPGCPANGRFSVVPPTRIERVTYPLGGDRSIH